MGDVPLACYGLRLHAEPHPLSEGAALAVATVGYGGLTITGIQLVRTVAGGFEARLPRLGRGNRLVLTSQRERDRLLALIAAAYHAVTSRDPAASPLAKASPTKDSFHDPA
jgi:hypothetical protein